MGAAVAGICSPAIRIRIMPAADILFTDFKICRASLLYDCSLITLKPVVKNKHHLSSIQAVLIIVR